MRVRQLFVLLVLPLVGCQTRSDVAQAPPPAPPDADLAFVSNRDGESEIYLRRAGRPEWINLSRHPAADNWPAWSPDGSRIAFQSLRNGNLDVFVMDADGGNVRQLTDDPSHDYLPSWSPDGREIAFASWRPVSDDATPGVHFFVVDADGGDARRLPLDPPGISAGVAWSPGGDYFVTTRKVGIDQSELFLHARDGRLVRKLTEAPAHHGAPAFSPDGTRIAYHADFGAASELRIVGVDGGAPSIVLSGGRYWYPRWSPDGEWLVYTAAVSPNDERDLDVMAIRADGSGPPVRLAGGPTREAEGAWRPPAR